MNSSSDQYLLRAYAESRSETAFAELARRHVDFVYSAALRMVRDTHLAQDVSQAVFVALAQNAGSLIDCSVLPGWLYRTTRNLAANVVRADVRRRVREQETVIMNALLSTESNAAWEEVVPYLDDAMAELDDTDRDAVLLRYFKNHDLRTVGATLGISDDAAQKRVSRAVERLREFFAKRGVTVGAGGLAVVISANAVQAAPVGLMLTISTAVTVSGASLVATTTATTVKTIAMTAVQKTAVAATIAVLAGVGIYEIHQASELRSAVQSLQQQQTPLTEQIRALQRERADMEARLAALAGENEQLKSGQKLAELLKLRGDVGVLRSENERLGQLFETEFVRVDKDLTEMRAKRWLERVKELKEKLAEMPEKSIPELKLLSDKTWLDIARNEGTASDPGHGIDESFARLRKAAKEEFGKRLSRALREYAKANGNQLPPDTMALKPYFASPVEDAMLERYEVLRTGEMKTDEPLVAERAAVDEKYDTLFQIGATGLWFKGVGSSGVTLGNTSQSWTVNDLPLNVQAEREAQSRRDEAELQQSLRRDVESEADDLDARILERAANEHLAALNGRQPNDFSFSDLLPYLRTPTERAAWERLKHRHGDE